MLAIIAVVMAASGLAGTPGARASGGAAAQPATGVPGLGTWSAPTGQLAGNTPYGPGGLACTSHDFCISIDAFGGTYLFQRGSWHKSHAVMPDTPKSINDAHGIGPDQVECGSPSLCVAGGNDGAVWLWNGTSWRADFAPHAGAQAVNPACPASSATPVCYLDIGNTFARYDGGTSWKSLGRIEPSPRTATDDISLSCPAASFCAAVEANGTQAMTWQGKSWSQPSDIPGLPSDSINSLSCAAAGQCVLFPSSLNGDINDLWRLAGGEWTQIPTGDSLPQDTQDDPDCLSVSYCLLASVGSAPSGALTDVRFGPKPNQVSLTTDTSEQAGDAVAVSCGSVCAVGLPGGSFTTASLSAPVITALSVRAGPTTGTAPYRAAGLPLPAPVQVRGRGLELADGVFFGDTPAASWQVTGNGLLLVQPPPGRPGVTNVSIAWAGGTAGADAASAYDYQVQPLSVTVTGEPSVTGHTGQPARVSITLVVAGQPAGPSRLVWPAGNGRAQDTAAVGPLAPGRHRLQLYASTASARALTDSVQVCLETGRTPVGCGYAAVAITSPPPTSQPWWEWLLAGLILGTALTALVGWRVLRHRLRPGSTTTAG